MNIDQINALPNSAKEKYMALERLYDQVGFKYLTEWAKAQHDECTARILNATSWEQHCVARGAQLAYQNFVNLEDISEAEFSSIADGILEQKRAEADGEYEIDNE